MKKEFNRHHRKCSSNGGNSKAENISIVDVRKHQAYHQLFDNLPPSEIARVLTDTWIDPNFIMVAVPRSKLSAVQYALKEK